MNLLHFPEGMQIAVVHLLFLPPDKISFPKPAPSLEMMPLIWCNRFCAAVNTSSKGIVLSKTKY